MQQIENMKEFYSSLDVFALPSLYEGFPVSAIEAQLCGIPTLMSESLLQVDSHKAYQGEPETLYTGSASGDW